MPKGRIEYKEAIPKLYRQGHLETAILYWVIGQQKILPHLPVKQCVNSFLQTSGIIPEKDIDLETAITIYHRAVSKLRDAERNVSNQIPGK